jgi:hypothetical protein
MKHKKAYLNMRRMLAVFALVIMTATALPSTVSAAKVECPDGTLVSMTGDQTYNQVCKDHQKDKNSDNNTSNTSADVTIKPQADPASNCDRDKCDLIKKYLNPLITFFSALVGIAVVISIIHGAIEYSSSGGDPQKAARGKQRITNAIIALVAFTFLFAFLQWLIPGGILNRSP